MSNFWSGFHDELEKMAAMSDEAKNSLTAAGGGAAGGSLLGALVGLALSKGKRLGGAGKGALIGGGAGAVVDGGARAAVEHMPRFKDTKRRVGRAEAALRR